ncbi:MAG: hypothetical protein QOK15_1748 [Nocardioidaceae bacterium]|nr:hypothetical protein [Nocardioidaceae bacterium]
MTATVLTRTDRRRAMRLRLSRDRKYGDAPAEPTSRVTDLRAGSIEMWPRSFR